MRYQTMLLTNPIDYAAANLLHQQQKVGPLFIIGVFLKAAQQHKSVGEIYRIPLCDTVDHGVIEIEFTEGGAVPKFEASPAFKQRMKNDAASDE